MSTSAPAQETNQSKPLRFIGPRETERKTGLSRWTLWRKENEGAFPRSIKIGNKRLWIEAEVDEWMRARIAERG